MITRGLVVMTTGVAVIIVAFVTVSFLKPLEQERNFFLRQKTCLIL